MSIKKSIKALVAVLVLGILATPVFALENQFSGRFASFFEASNYSSSGTLQNDAPSANYFVQRLRLGYVAKIDDVKLVSKFEIDHNYWGNSSYVVGRGAGGALGADSINLETKNVYLDWTIPSVKLNAKIGMQGFADIFSGILFDNDMSGILLNHSYDNADASVGYFRWNDSSTDATLGRDTMDLAAIAGEVEISSALKIGGAYYYIQDDSNVYGTDGAKVHTLGMTAKMATQVANLNAFILGQTGDYKAGTDAKGYAANLGANFAVGNGTLRGDILYAAGGKNKLFVSPDLVGYYPSEMMILTPDKNATTIDNALIYGLDNNGEGAIIASVGFDLPLSQTLSASFNLGFGMVADNNGDDIATDSNEDIIGTEINFELVKKVTDNLSLAGRAAYVFLGDHNMGNLDDPYAAQLLVAYSF